MRHFVSLRARLRSGIAAGRASGTHRLAAGALCALVLSAGVAPAADVTERREALARVVEQINDPDPLMRIAHLEAIVARGNATEIQLAVKATFAGTDADLKAVALRGYLSRVNDLYLDTRPTRELEALLGRDDEKAREVVDARNRTAQWRQATGDRVQVRVSKLDVASGRFSAYGMNRSDKTDERLRGDGQVLGTRVRASFGMVIASRLKRCSIELAPTSALQFEGTVVCDDFPKMLVSAPMF